LIDRTNRSAYALQLGAHAGVRTMRTPSVVSRSSTSTPLRIAIADQDVTVAYDTRAVTRHLPQRLHDEALVRIRRAAEHMDTARVQLNDEGGVVGHQPTRRPHLGREEVGGDQRWPVRLQECTPCHRTLPTRGDAVCVENARDRRPSNAMAEILQGSLDSRVAPRGILRRHAHHQCTEMSRAVRTDNVRFLARVVGTPRAFPSCLRS